MDKETEKLCRSAYDTYLATLEQVNLEPSFNYLPYEFDYLDNLKWEFLGRRMVASELQELTNNINQWCSYLRRWNAWNLVIEKYNKEDAWILRIEFLEALVHHCLLQPSAIRDQITFVATNVTHQVRLSSESNYKDYLDGDPTSPEEKPQYPTRRTRETRLNKLLSQWSAPNNFMEQLRKIDHQTYRQQTSDYRNKHSHTIGPRLGVGITQPVVRKLIQATKRVEQTDKTWIQEPIPGKLAVSYSFGGTMPLNMEDVRIINLEQYKNARTCYRTYIELLKAKIKLNP